MFNARGEVVGIVCAGANSFDGLAFGIPANELVDFLNHRDSYAYDPAQPQNGIKYLSPPSRNGQEDLPEEMTPVVQEPTTAAAGESEQKP
jgi:hypothetical protein